MITQYGARERSTESGSEALEDIHFAEFAQSVAAAALADGDGIAGEPAGLKHTACETLAAVARMSRWRFADAKISPN